MTLQGSGSAEKQGNRISGQRIICRLLLVCLAAFEAGHGQETRFPLELGQGIMAGEVTQTSVILQSRLTAIRARVERRWSGVIRGSGVAIPSPDGSSTSPWAASFVFPFLLVDRGWLRFEFSR